MKAVLAQRDAPEQMELLLKYWHMVNTAPNRLNSEKSVFSKKISAELRVRLRVASCLPLPPAPPSRDHLMHVARRSVSCAQGEEYQIRPRSFRTRR